MNPWEPGAFIVIEPEHVYIALTKCRNEIERLNGECAILRTALKTHTEEAAKLLVQRDELLSALRASRMRYVKVVNDGLMWNNSDEEHIDMINAAINNAANTTNERK